MGRSNKNHKKWDSVTAIWEKHYRLPPLDKFTLSLQLVGKKSFVPD